MGATRAPVLDATGLTRRFGSVVALDRVDFALGAGEIHCLMGENGAGKSTLVKCLTGVHRPDAGEIRLGGAVIAPRSPRDAEALGISTVYQEVHLIPHLSVAENIGLGREPVRAGGFGWIHRRKLRERATRALARLGLELDADAELAAHSIAVQQLIAIARALDVDARVLILDEPTSSLDRHEVAELFAVLRRLRETGLAILFITHFLDQVYAVADRITVLRDGQRVLESAVGELSRAELVRGMVGRDFEEHAPRERGHPTGPGETPWLEARGLLRRGALEHGDVAIAEGEAVGLAGLLGSGRTELARMLFGADRPDAGKLSVGGRRVEFRRPSQAIRLGIALAPEDRKHSGVIPGLSVRENIELALQARAGFRRVRGIRGRADELFAALDIRCASADVPIASLSGGNQQKALLARWLAIEPRLFILDEPTRGIDVAAKAEILRVIERLRAEGMAILFISSELDEVVRVCDRISILRDRRTVAELSGSDASESGVMAAIAGETSG